MTATQHTQINAESGYVTLINIYEVAPERQGELARLLADGTEESMRQMRGFVSVNIHCSLDGTRVVNYAQWASKDDFERMLKDPSAQAQMREFAAVATSVSPALYQVSSVHN
jgi:heme-degrading monooxygenase HmoA